MKKNKLLTIMLIILVSITLIGVVALVVVTQLSKDGGGASAEPSIDEIIEQSVDVPEISTNLNDRRYVKLSLKIQTDSKEAAEELTKRDFQIKDILVEVLSDMSSKDLQGTKGKELLTNALKAKFNGLMQNGEVQKVYITSFAVS